VTYDVSIPAEKRDSIAANNWIPNSTKTDTADGNCTEYADAYTADHWDAKLQSQNC